ncbi:hypothetical protein [Aquimarina sp. AU58]|uniref:hypothetical protein n=1 Tax=Aquimarina sp. AU58 TaxID=1874112 RepID=UPI001359D18E|nr:hypothetical protein [Aquimarina sp. AU58]
MALLVFDRFVQSLSKDSDLQYKTSQVFKTCEVCCKIITKGKEDPQEKVTDSLPVKVSDSTVVDSI